MEFFRTPDINFVGVARRALLVSGIVLLAGFVSMGIQRGLKQSRRFAGGALVEVRTESPVPLQDIRTIVAAAGVDFMPAPNDVYYARVDQRLQGHKEDLARLRRDGILIDGEGVVEGGYTKVLLQRFGKTAIGQLTLEDHQRAWSYLDYCLREWREPFVAMLADLRRQKEVRDSFMKHLQCTPEIFDERWCKRVLGKRRSMAPGGEEEGELAENESPNARERKSLRAETDFNVLAARIRALGTIDDPATIDALLDQFGKNSELVRETAMVSLLKVKAPPCLERVPAYGLVHADPMVRAYSARACGKKVIKSAMPALRTMIVEDRHWLARAEAAVASGILKDEIGRASCRGRV